MSLFALMVVVPVEAVDSPVHIQLVSELEMWSIGESQSKAQIRVVAVDLEVGNLAVEHNYSLLHSNGQYHDENLGSPDGAAGLRERFQAQIEEIHEAEHRALSNHRVAEASEEEFASFEGVSMAELARQMQEEAIDLTLRTRLRN